jgi:hypothetical protein
MEERAMNEKRINPLKKVVAVVCHHCPFCSYGRKYPDSILGKMMHHKIHADNCPLWKAEKELYGDQAKDQ